MMRQVFIFIALLTSVLFGNGQFKAVLKAPASVPRFDVAEFIIQIPGADFANPFTDVRLTGVFIAGADTVRTTGFADSMDGSLFLLRFSPKQSGVRYRYTLTLKANEKEQQFAGTLKCSASKNEGPVIVDPEKPKHFMYAGSGRSFYHLGFTAYHLLDSSNDDAQVDATIDYCVKNGFNKIRFLLAGYARDENKFKLSTDFEHGGENETQLYLQKLRAYNYGALPDRVNALPAWPGSPHQYDFTRFNVGYWQRVDRAVRRMREKGIVANCIFTIEKRGLPKELGPLSVKEILFYRYAIARLSAFDNLWWDLGNEHNETRTVDWGNAMGALVKQADPYDRLTSAHAYADFPYSRSAWADFIITQQYGKEGKVHQWTLNHSGIPKPYVNEEYGYEGNADTAGHSQNRDITLRAHWAIAMAGGYATYGDWSEFVSYFYMGIPGPGKAGMELQHMRRFFEGLPFRDLVPSDSLTSHGFCLAQPSRYYVFYFPRGGTNEIDLSSANKTLFARWFNPRTGIWQETKGLQSGKNKVPSPTNEDWVLLVENRKGVK